LRGEGAGDDLGIFGVGEKTAGNHERVLVFEYYIILLYNKLKENNEILR